MTSDLVSRSLKPIYRYRYMFREIYENYTSAGLENIVFMVNYFIYL